MATFFRRYLRHTKGESAGRAVEFEGWQRWLVDELFRLDEDGRRVYTEATIGLPRKNAKSTLCAGLGLYLLGPDREPGAEVYASAGSAEQASIVFGQAKAFIESDYAEPRLREMFIPRLTVIRSPRNAGFLRRLAADGKMNHGLNPHGVIIDELHAWVTDRQEANYEALVTAQGARTQPLTVIISTAGDDPDTILGRLHKAALEDPRIERVGDSWGECGAGLLVLRAPETKRLFVWWGAGEDADIADPRVWRAANPATWVPIEYLRRQHENPNVPEASFRKLHLNQFVKARSAWLPWGTWAQLVSGLAVPKRVAVGIDVGLTQDTTAVTWAGRADDGSERLVLRSRVWSARDDVPHDVFVPGGRVELGLVEDFVRQLGRDHAVDRVHYDPRYFERSAQLLSDEGFTVAPLVQSSAPMADAYQEFYQDARLGRITHDGDPVLAAHVESTAAVQTERGWRVSKLRSNRRIDACVAACMALYGARRIDTTERAGWLIVR